MLPVDDASDNTPMCTNTPTRSQEGSLASLHPGRNKHICTCWQRDLWDLLKGSVEGNGGGGGGGGGQGGADEGEWKGKAEMEVGSFTEHGGRRRVDVTGEASCENEALTAAWRTEAPEGPGDCQRGGSRETVVDPLRSQLALNPPTSGRRKAAEVRKQPARGEESSLSVNSSARGEKRTVNVLGDTHTPGRDVEVLKSGIVTGEAHSSCAFPQNSRAPPRVTDAARSPEASHDPLIRRRQDTRQSEGSLARKHASLSTCC